MKLTFEEFAKHAQGRTFADAITGSQKALKELPELVSPPDLQQRLEVAEEHFERAAIAGVVLDLEHLPSVVKVLEGDVGAAKRLRQAAGAAVRILMEGRGWRKTGRKGAVGVAVHFSRAEHYERKGGG